MEKTVSLSETPVITPAILKEHWQGHRRLTRRVIEAFPEDKLFTFSIGGMRTFGAIAIEMLTMAKPGVHGIATGEWLQFEEMEKGVKENIKTKADVLRLWDEATEYIETMWPKIKPERWLEEDKAFDTYGGPVYWFLHYFVDNEIHHRGQGYVYLRALGIEPPYFWER